jgi:hypothetical protein
MRNSKTCPKCRSTDVIRIPGRYSRYSPGINIIVGWTNLSAIQVTRYLCASCGFIEAWVDSSDDIAKIKKKYASCTNSRMD